MFEPVQECGLKDAADAVEGVAGEPDQLAAAEAEAADMLHLLAQGGGVDAVGEMDLSGAIGDFAGDMDGGKVLPDELEHEELVEVSVEE